MHFNEVALQHPSICLCHLGKLLYPTVNNCPGAGETLWLSGKVTESEYKRNQKITGSHTIRATFREKKENNCPSGVV
jgi:hypothetical protein